MKVLLTALVPLVWLHCGLVRADVETAMAPDDTLECQTRGAEALRTLEESHLWAAYEAHITRLNLECTADCRDHLKKMLLHEQKENQKHRDTRKFTSVSSDVGVVLKNSVQERELDALHGVPHIALNELDAGLTPVLPPLLLQLQQEHEEEEDDFGFDGKRKKQKKQKIESVSVRHTKCTASLANSASANSEFRHAVCPSVSVPCI
ncbi:MAG: hypothetical protein MHM6MM_006358 [Cercozoa sp. M6MM]